MSAKIEPQANPPRLRREKNSLGRALEQAGRQAEKERPIAKARVWRALESGPRKRALAWLPGGAIAAVALSCAAVLAVVVVVRGHGSPAAESVVASGWQVAQGTAQLESSVEGAAPSASAAASPTANGAVLPLHGRVRAGEGAAVLEREGVRVALAPGAVLALEEMPKLVEGSAAVSMPAANASAKAQRFQMSAGSSLVDASGGIFFASVLAERVQVQSESAALEVHDGAHTIPLEAGKAWSQGATRAAEPSVAKGGDDDSFRALVALARPDANPAALRAVALLKPAARGRRDHAEILEALAQSAEGEQRYTQAASLYQELAEVSEARAATALYELARIRLRFLGQPAAALSALEQARTQVPESPIAQEIALTAIEARLALGQDAATLREMNSFLDRFAQSERAGEVRWLQASLELREGPCSAARRDLEALVPDAKFGGEALFALSSCERDRGGARGQRARLQEYLRRFPEGPHAHEAQVALHQSANGTP